MTEKIKQPDVNALDQAGQLPASPTDPAVVGKPIDTTPKPRGFNRIATAAIFADLPPHKWICEYLGWTPGRPAMVQGYSYSGKSIIVQSAVLHLAAGRKLWGSNGIGGIGDKPEQPIRVLHIDHEQGEYATRNRYKRLAAGMNLDPLDLGGRLDLVCYPDIFLSSGDKASKEAEEIYLKECRAPDDPEHVDLCVIDSLRAATPGIDENDSRMGDVMSLLARVSDKTRTAFVVIHHEGKSANRRDDGRETGRGSSAIFAGAGSVIRVVGGVEKGDPLPRRLEMVKNAAESKRAEMDPFYLEFRNIEHGGDLDGALWLRFMTRADGEAAWEAAKQGGQGQQTNGGGKGAQRREIDPALDGIGR